MIPRLGIVAVLAGALAGCGDSTGVEVADLAGSYAATKLEFVSVNNPADTVDVFQAGVTVDLEIAENGDFELTVHSPGDADEVDTGTVELDGDKITLQSSDPSSGTFSLIGDILRLHLTTGVEFDFDNSGTDDPAEANLVFVRS
jgi:hypothetical protein